MNFNKLCNDLLKSHPKIRFAGVLNSRGDLLAQKIRDDSASLLSNEEFKMLVYYTTDRLNSLQNLEHKLGRVKETITKYENANTITLFLDKNIFMISTDPNSNNSKISSDLCKSIVKKSVKKTKQKLIKKKSVKKNTSKKKPKSHMYKKDKIPKLKPKLDKLEKRINSLYQKHKN